jgi:hypothetical protein
MSQENIRATFVMRKGSRDLLKAVAHRYGVSQSEIMNTAPFLFIVLAERSLKRRQSDLGMLKTLADQAWRSIASMPGHIVIGDVDQLLEHAVELERQSIANNQVHGPSEEDIENLSGRCFPPYGDPFAETLKTALEEVGASATVARYRAMLETNDDYDSFWDEEEAERIAQLNIVLDEDDLAPTVAKTALSPASEPKTAEAPAGRWVVTLKDREIAVDSGADALEGLLKHLVRIDPAALEKLRPVGGRVRHLIADAPDRLYPGRPDLAHFSREFIPGWFMGTNYSSQDVRRLIRAAAEAVGLQWGIDIFMTASPG